MSNTKTEAGGSLLAGMAAALFCTVTWLGGGLVVLAFLGGPA